MENKAKFIIIALLGLILIIAFFCLQIYSSKQAAISQREALKKDKISLINKLEDVLKESKRLEERVSLLNTDLDIASKEKQDLQKKFELIKKEREELVNKLKFQPALTSTPAIEQQMQPLQSQASTEAYWAGILKAKTNLELQLESIRSQLKTLQINNEQLQKDKNVLELELKSLAREKQDLEQQYAYNQKRSQEMIDKLAQGLVIEKNDKFKIAEDKKSLKSENEILKRQLNTQGARKTNLETQIAELEKEKTDFENKLSVMDALLKDNIMQIDNFKRQLEAAQTSKIALEAKKETVELEPIIVRPKQEIQVAASGVVGPKAKIVSVNEENNFVIIDLGEDAGLRLGDVFQVYRQDKQIATVAIIQLRQDISACDIKKQTSPIKPGDTVR